MDEIMEAETQKTFQKAKITEGILQKDFLSSEIPLTDGTRRYVREYIDEGSLGLVFKAVDLDDPDNPDKWVAVKVAKPGDSDAAFRLEEEWDTLKRLERIDQQTHYFPRVVYPEAKGSVREGAYYSSTLGLTPVPISMMGMEFIHGLKLGELDMASPPTPEPVAIEILRQYLDSVKLAAEAGIYVVDRKEGCLRWLAAREIKEEESKTLKFLKNGIGQLKVIDWNVVTYGQPSNMSNNPLSTSLVMGAGLDRNFILLFTDTMPEYGKGKSRRLENSREMAQRLSKKSYMTRLLILREFSSNYAGEGSVSVGEAIEMLKKQFSLFSLSADELMDKAQEGVTTADKEEVEEAFACADTLRVMIQIYGVDEPENFKKTYRTLARCLVNDQITLITDRLQNRRWAIALDQIEKLNELFCNAYYLGRVTACLKEICQSVRDAGNSGQMPNISEIIDLSIRREDLTPEEVERLKYLSEVWKDDILWGDILAKLEDFNDTDLSSEKPPPTEVVSESVPIVIEKPPIGAKAIWPTIIGDLINFDPENLPAVWDPEGMDVLAARFGIDPSDVKMTDAFSEVVLAVRTLLKSPNNYGVKSSRDDLSRLLNAPGLAKKQIQQRQELIRKIAVIADKRLPDVSKIAYPSA